MTRRQAHPRAGAPVHRARHPEPDRVRGHLPAARGAARPLHGPRLARLPVAPTTRADDAARARRAATACSTSSRWPTWARCSPRRPAAGRGARQRGAAPLRRRGARRDARRPARRARRLARAPGLMLFRAAKALAALDGRDHALPDDVQELAPAGADPPPAAGARRGRRRARRRWCATRWSGSRRCEVPRAGGRRRRSARRWPSARPPPRSTRASLYVPGIALIAARRRRGRLGARWPRAARRSSAQPGPHTVVEEQPWPLRLGVRSGRAAAARRRAARAAARLAGADRRPLVAARCGSTCASRAAGGASSSRRGW